MSAPARREQVAFAVARGASQRRACYLLSVARSTLGYESRLAVKDAPVKVVDTSKCSRCDQPRLPYGVMCRGCLRNYEAERRRKAGVQPRSTACETPGCGQPKATPHGKFCRVCYDQRQESKVKASSRAKMSTAAKAVEKQVPRRWDTALPGRGVTEPVVGAEVFAKPEPVQPTRPVTRIRAADADEREAREREWAEWLQRRTVKRGKRETVRKRKRKGEKERDGEDEEEERKRRGDSE